VVITRNCDLFNCSNCTQLLPFRKDTQHMSLECAEEALKCLQGWPGIIACFGGNPSLAGDTRVYTVDGIFPISDLEGKRCFVKNLNGETSPATCRLSGRKKRLWEVKLKGGHTYYATAEHKWPAMLREVVPRPGSGWGKLQCSEPHKLKTVELQPGMRLPVIRSRTLGYGRDGTYDDGFLAGWLLGDGWITERKSRPRKQRLQEASFARKDGLTDRRFTKGGLNIGMIVNAEDFENGTATKLTQQMRKLGSDASWRAVKRCHELSTGSDEIDAWLDRFGIVGKADGLPSAIWTTASEQFRCGFIDGLFSADGNVDLKRKPGYTTVCLTTAHERLAKDVAELLGFYGIRTTVGARVRRNQSFPGGKAYDREYTSYEVRISSGADVAHFASCFKLTNPRKQAALETNLGKSKGDARENSVEIVSVTATDRYEDVWDLTVEDETHCFQLGHCVTGNCSHPQFPQIAALWERYVPPKQRGLWTNNLMTHGDVVRRVFYPDGTFNLNVHGSQRAREQMQKYLPGIPVWGTEGASHHGQVIGHYKDYGISDEEWLKKREACTINQNWSGAIYERDGAPYMYFCEVAGSHDGVRRENHGVRCEPGCWEWGMEKFQHQVRECCDRSCIVPCNFRGHNDLQEIYTISPSLLPLTENQSGRVAVQTTDGTPQTVHELTDYESLRADQDTKQERLQDAKSEKRRHRR
jgi:hypothetical protein